MPDTGLTVVSTALRRAGIFGIGGVPDANDFMEGYNTFADMLAAWNDMRWLSWHELDIGVVSTGQTTPYTVGPGQQFAVTPRPPRIEAAYLLQIINAGNPVSTPLRVIQAREEYSEISLKELVSFPQCVFLDTAYPVGNLYIYPYPNAAIYEVHILVRDVWPNTISATTAFSNYPPSSIPAMKYNLAMEFRQNYGLGENSRLEKLAAHYLRVVRNAQIQVPELNMPRMLVGPARYNILSDSM